MLLPLCLLLKNAPKKTFGHTSVPQGSQMRYKMELKLIQNMIFYQSEQCVSHIVNIMFFFASASPKCDQKQTKNHPASHSVTMDLRYQKSLKLLSKYSKVGPDGPWRPVILATFVILMCFGFEVRKMIDFFRLLSKFGEGPAAGGGACLKLQILQILDSH